MQTAEAAMIFVAVVAVVHMAETAAAATAAAGAGDVDVVVAIAGGLVSEWESCQCACGVCMTQRLN